MREFLRLQLKLKWGFNRDNNRTSAVMTAIAALIAVLIALALVWTLSYVLKASIDVSDRRLSELYLTVILSGLTVAATGMQTKRLYRPGDLNISARFPLSPFKLFVSYLILNYIDLSVYSAAVSLPVMLAFGIAARCVSFAYVAGVLLAIVLLPLIPFGLSIFIAIPTAYLMSLLERYRAIRLVLFVLLLIGAFALYNELLTVLAQFFLHRNWETGTLEIWTRLLAALDTPYNPAYYLGNILFFERFGLGLGVVLGVGAALIALGAALARTVCASLRKRALDGGTDFCERRSAIDGYGSARAIFRYGFKEILRTSVYSYFYLGVAISTPVMVFFCNRLVSLTGEAQIGSGIGFGAATLVVSVFMAMICSFTGTVLSVEGKSFYITKLIPVSYRKQLLVKGLLYFGVSAAALGISAAVLGRLHFLNASEMTALILTQLLFAAGLVLNGINLNLANPNLKPKANGEAEEINIAYMLLIGLTIAAALGGCSVIFPKSPAVGTPTAYLIGAAIAAVYAAVNFLVFWFTADRKYRKIEA